MVILNVYGKGVFVDLEIKHLLNCVPGIYSRAIETWLHEKPYDLSNPNILGMSLGGIFIISNDVFAEWEVITSQRTIPSVPFDIFYNGTFCRVTHLTTEDDNVYYQERLEDDFEYYAIFKIVREDTLKKLKKYIKDNPVRQFYCEFIAVDDSDMMVYCVLVIIDRDEYYRDLDLVIDFDEEYDEEEDYDDDDEYDDEEDCEDDDLLSI